MSFNKQRLLENSSTGEISKIVKETSVIESQFLLISKQVKVLVPVMRETIESKRVEKNEYLNLCLNK